MTIRAFPHSSPWVRPQTPGRCFASSSSQSHHVADSSRRVDLIFEQDENQKKSKNHKYGRRMQDAIDLGYHLSKNRSVKSLRLQRHLPHHATPAPPHACPLHPSAVPDTKSSQTRHRSTNRSEKLLQSPIPADITKLPRRTNPAFHQRHILPNAAAQQDRIRTLGAKGRDGRFGGVVVRVHEPR